LVKQEGRSRFIQNHQRQAGYVFIYDTDESFSPAHTRIDTTSCQISARNEAGFRLLPDGYIQSCALNNYRKLEELLTGKLV
jgi:hypothetical protein